MYRFMRSRWGWIAALSALAVFMPVAAWAQSVNIDLGQGPTTTARLVQLMLLITVLGLAPSILVMITSFTRIVVVLSFLRSAIGVQQTPPNIVLISLALFLTMFVMQPTFEKAWEEGIRPLMNGEIDEETSFGRTIDPFHDFMMRHTREKDIALFADMAKTAETIKAQKAEAAPEQSAPQGKKNQAAAKKTEAKPPETKAAATESASDEVSLRVLIPAFMISELRRAFEIGFLLFLPFLIIDMVIASILMSMGMMMMPPSVVSMPFKIVFFVLVDGWYLISGSLVQSYGGG